jgi:hypothetical protein
MGYLDTIGRAMTLHGFTTFSPGTAAAGTFVQFDEAARAANARFANVAAGANWDAIAAQFVAMSGVVNAISIRNQGAGLRVIMWRTPPRYDAAAEHDFVEAAGNWMKAMRAAGAAYQLNDQTKEAIKTVATTAGASAPLVTGLGLVASFAEFHAELFAVVVDVGEQITGELKQAWSQTDLTVVTSAGYTRVFGWLWDITTQTVTQGGKGSFDEYAPLAPGLATPHDLEGTLRQVWA